MYVFIYSTNTVAPLLWLLCARHCWTLWIQTLVTHFLSPQGAHSRGDENQFKIKLFFPASGNVTFTCRTGRMAFGKLVPCWLWLGFHKIKNFQFCSHHIWNPTLPLWDTSMVQERSASLSLWKVFIFVSCAQTEASGHVGFPEIY